MKTPFIPRNISLIKKKKKRRTDVPLLRCFLFAWASFKLRACPVFNLAMLYVEATCNCDEKA